MFNKINFGGGKERKPGSTGDSSGGGGVDFDQIDIGQNSTRHAGERRINFSLFKKGAKSRAEEAVDAARLQQLAQQEEQKRQGGIRIGRRQITEIISTSESVRTGEPGIDFGLPDNILRRAKGDPNEALRLATKHINSIQRRNDRIEDEIDRLDTQVETAKNTREILKENPIMTWGKLRKVDPEAPAGKKLLQSSANLVLNLGSFVGKAVTSSVLGQNPVATFNDIRVTDAGIKTYVPFSPKRSVDITQDNVSDYLITTDTPGYLDKLYGLFGVFKPNRGELEQDPVWGTLGIVYAPGNIEIVKQFTFRPERKRKQITQAMKDMRTPSFDEYPTPLAVPTMASLLGPYAKEAGLVDQKPAVRGEIYNSNRQDDLGDLILP